MMIKVLIDKSDLCLIIDDLESSGLDILFDGETKVVTETYKLNHPVL